MKTTALSVDSAVARMVRLVEESQNLRSKTEMLVEKVAKYYTPGTVLSRLFGCGSQQLCLSFLCGIKWSWQHSASLPCVVTRLS